MAERGVAAFYKSTFQIIGAFFCYFICRGLIQALAGPIGLGISKWVGPLLAAVMWLAIANLAETNKLRLSGGTLRSWTNVALWSLTGPVIAWIQFQIGAMLMGADSVAALAKIDDMK